MDVSEGDYRILKDLMNSPPFTLADAGIVEVADRVLDAKDLPKETADEKAQPAP
jgi:hypothetical protein